MSKIILVYHQEDPNLTRKFFSDTYKAVEYAAGLVSKNIGENGVIMEGRQSHEPDVVEWLNSHLCFVE